MDDVSFKFNWWWLFIPVNDFHLDVLNFKSREKDREIFPIT